MTAQNLVNTYRINKVQLISEDDDMTSCLDFVKTCRNEESCIGYRNQVVSISIIMLTIL